MEFIAYNRSVNIKSSPEKVISFVRYVPNLPKWTHFFLSVGESNEDRYAVETKFGHATTWSETVQTPQGYELILYSLLGNHVESAHLYLVANAQGTQLTFEIHLPSSWTMEQIEAQLQELHGELLKLKALVEIEYSLSVVKAELERLEFSTDSPRNFFDVLTT